jgi:hypothetical protein
MQAQAGSFDDDLQNQYQEPAPAVTGGQSAMQTSADNWASWDDAGPAASAAAPTSAEAPPADDWAAFDQNEQSNFTEEAAVEPEPVEPEAEAEPINYDELRQVTVLYNFDAQNNDELTINENEVVYVSNEECDEEGWVVCINANGEKGYVPCNYLDMGEEAAPAEAEPPLDTNTVQDTFRPLPG